MSYDVRRALGELVPLSENYIKINEEHAGRHFLMKRVMLLSMSHNYRNRIQIWSASVVSEILISLIRCRALIVD